MKNHFNNTFPPDEKLLVSRIIWKMKNQFPQAGTRFLLQTLLPLNFENFNKALNKRIPFSLAGMKNWLKNTFPLEGMKNLLKNMFPLAGMKNSLKNTFPLAGMKNLLKNTFPLDGRIILKMKNQFPQAGARFLLQTLLPLNFENFNKALNKRILFPLAGMKNLLKNVSTWRNEKFVKKYVPSSRKDCFHSQEYLTNRENRFSTSQKNSLY